MLLQARLLGLDRIVALGRSAPCASDYWLHHYGALDDRRCRFFVVCGLGACVGDSLLVAVMEDARVPRRSEALAGIAREQNDFLHGCPRLAGGVWHPLWAPTRLGLSFATMPCTLRP